MGCASSKPEVHSGRRSIHDQLIDGIKARDKRLCSALHVLFLQTRLHLTCPSPPPQKLETAPDTKQLRSLDQVLMKLPMVRPRGCR